MTRLADERGCDMTDQPSTEDLVREFGEPLRERIVDALAWLDRSEPGWGLAEPIERREYIREVLSRLRTRSQGGV